MKTIENIYENYKAANNEETPVSKEVTDTFDKMMERIDAIDNAKFHQEIFDSVVAYARAYEKNGFVEGFKMAFSIFREL